MSTLYFAYAKRPALADFFGKAESMELRNMHSFLTLSALLRWSFACGSHFGLL
jgi:hypothetical protein